MKHNFRIIVLALGSVVFGLTGCAHYAAQQNGSGNGAQANSPQPVTHERVVSQKPGKVVYWILPGPRQLSPDVFGTPDNPKFTVMPQIKMAKKMEAAHKMPPHVDDVLKRVPILVGVPLMARSKHADGTWWMDKPTPFSDKGRIVAGSFNAHYYDVVSLDPPGKPPMTPDHATMEARFDDPAGNHYRVVVRHVVKPPFPGYETEGGVMIDGSHHGKSGTGSPLMPKVNTYAALWAMGDVFINGELVAAGQVMHMMTTDVVRDRNYHLALNSEVPLAPDQYFIKGQSHHTHLIVLPIKGTEEGPVFSPLKTAFKLPNGMMQPFVHIMYEQDSIDR